MLHDEMEKLLNMYPHLENIKFLWSRLFSQIFVHPPTFFQRFFTLPLKFSIDNLKREAKFFFFGKAQF